MIVVDAGVVLALILPLPFSDGAAAMVRALKQAREQLFAPALLEYEVCSALRRAVARTLITEQEAGTALDILQGLHIRPITPASSLHIRALSWATRLQQSKAYDAQYVALAEEMHCRLLTTDMRLVRAAQGIGADWVIGVDQRAC